MSYVHVQKRENRENHCPKTRKRTKNVCFLHKIKGAAISNVYISSAKLTSRKSDFISCFQMVSNKTDFLLPEDMIPCGLVARIRRFHRRGRGSIPHKGVEQFFGQIYHFDNLVN